MWQKSIIFLVLLTTMNFHQVVNASDVNSIGFEKLYRTAIVVDRNIMKPNTCMGNCDEIDVHNYKGDDFNCRHLHRCSRLYSYKSCELRSPSPKLYEWIHTSDNSDSIPSQCDGHVVDHPSYVFDSFLYKCENCKCICEGFTRSSSESPDEGVSLLMSRANTDDNMVVTGLRFAKKGDIICIELKQGKLIANGHIKEGSEYWSSCTLPDMNSETGFLKLRYQFSLMSFADLTLPKNSVVTGATFGPGQPEAGGASRLEINLEYMKFDFATGQLRSHRRTLLPRIRSENLINDGDMKNPLRPESSRDPPIVQTQHGGYIKFWMSDFKTDAGQTTLPLFEATNVESVPSAPLKGAGLFYKATPGYGGFISLRIYPLD